MGVRGLFVTGTDTDVGKTWVTVALMRYFQRKGWSVAGMKPVAAGCEWQAGRWQNQDALLLQQNASKSLPYEQVNPYAFEQPVSPHLACGKVVVDLQHLLSGYANLQRQFDTVLVEGAGGWLSPLSKNLDNATLAVSLEIPVLLVVGMRLGCINQARLTLQAVRKAGVRCLGVAVELEPCRSDYQGNLAYLRESLALPLLAQMPYLESANFEVLADRFVIESAFFDIDQMPNCQGI